MSAGRRAVIDVGTNSVKLLVAEVAGHDVQLVHEDSKQTRLGQGFYETQRLQPANIAKTAEVVARFAGTARTLNAPVIRVIATSAARDAKNAQALTDAIERASGLKVEIISGDQEADWVYQGVTTDPELAKHPLLLLDVGGGSTEFILGHGDRKDFRHSFPLGTVRLLERLPPGDPPTASELAACREWVRDFLRNEVRRTIAAELRQEAASDAVTRHVLLVGTGGTATILARMEAGMVDYDRARIESTRLNPEQLQVHVERLWRLPLDRRQGIAGLPPKRADVILMGAVIYEAVMKEFGFNELRVSTRGLRYAAAMADA